MMKKIIMTLLALVMILSLSATAFADTINNTNFTDGTATDTGEVEVTVHSDHTTVYEVDVSWSDLEFTYNFGRWDPQSHTYSGSWEDNKDTGNIVVTNHSNAVIQASASLAVDVVAEQAGVTVAFGEDVEIENAAEVSYGNRGTAPNKNIQVKLTGTPDVGTTTISWACVVTITDISAASGN